MKLQELEDADQLVTKDFLRGELVRLENKLDAAINRLDARLNRLEWLVWLPVISTVAQIVWGHK
jgi:hypothetical protein